MTVISSLQSSTLQSAGTSAGHALEVSDERKFTEHLSACEEAGILFVPLSVEALGGWLPIAAKTIRRIASMAAARSACADPGQAACYLMQQLSVVLQKGNSTLLLSRYCSLVFFLFYANLVTFFCVSSVIVNLFLLFCMYGIL